MIITIIILIILAAISIKAIIDTKMIQTAVSGAENYVEAGETENEVMQDTADYIDSIVASIKGEDTSGGSSGTGTDLSTLTETERLALVGQYVDYTPDSGNSYTLAQSSTYTGNTNNSKAFTTDTDLNWRIWSIDDDELILISDTTQQSGGYNYTSSSTYGWCLCLTGAYGYNNGVKLLNDICETCYSSSSVNGTGVKATARSLDIVDIEDVLDWSVWKPTDYICSSKYPCYDMNTTLQYTSSSYRKYPTIWAEEDFANINGTTVNEAYYTYDETTNTHTYTSTNNTLRRNAQTDLYTSTYSTADSYIEVTNTYWYATASTLSSAYVDSKYASLVNCGINYWLASRYVWPSSSLAVFGLQVMDSGGDIGYEYSFRSNGNAYTLFYGVRPVVSIPLSSLALDLTSNTGDTSDDAYQIVAK